MADREDMLNELTGNAPADEPALNHEPAEPPEPIETPEPVESVEPQEADEPAGPLSGKSAAELLDSITEPDPSAPKPEELKPAEPESAPEVKPEDPAAPKTLEQQEAEALDGIKSERGRERIKAVFAERKALEQTKTQLETDITEFRQMVTSTGLAPQEFAQMLEVGRLMKSSSEQDRYVALQMIEQQRAELAKALGIDAPGVDQFADFPQLKAAVEQGQLTQEHALRLAKFERQEQARQQNQQQQAAQQENMAQFERSIAQASQTAETYFNTRKGEADYPAKMAQIQAKFQRPEFVQEFVQSYEPKQWFGIFKMMYDSIQIPQAPRAQVQQPIRSRPVMSGTPASNPSEPLTNRLMSHIDSLGI